jgi:hypothetical protein
LFIIKLVTPLNESLFAAEFTIELAVVVRKNVSVELVPKIELEIKTEVGVTIDKELVKELNVWLELKLEIILVLVLGIVLVLVLVVVKVLVIVLLLIVVLILVLVLLHLLVLVLLLVIIVVVDLIVVKNEVIHFIEKNFKVPEMQNSSEVFKSNFDYYQRVAHKKLFGQFGQNLAKSGQLLEKVYSLEVYVFTQTNMIF